MPFICVFLFLNYRNPRNTWSDWCHNLHSHKWWCAASVAVPSALNSGRSALWRSALALTANQRVSYPFQFFRDRPQWPIRRLCAALRKHSWTLRVGCIDWMWSALVAQAKLSRRMTTFSLLVFRKIAEFAWLVAYRCHWHSLIHCIPGKHVGLISVW